MIELQQTTDMAKGRNKRRRSSLFTPGNTLRSSYDSSSRATTPEEKPKSRKIIRLTRNKQELVENSPVGEPVNMHNPEAPMLLRPSDEPTMTEDSVDETYRVLSHHKLLNLFSKAQANHKSCPGVFQWDPTAETKWGLCWKMGLQCNVCHYKTGSEKLYFEIQKQGRGRKAATANAGIQVGLTQSMIGDSMLRMILMCTNIEPPTTRAMQQQANRVGDSLIELNTANMKKQRRNTKEPSQCQL